MRERDFNLAQKIDSIIQEYSKSLEIPDSGSGNLYILNLFRNILIFFVDKFDFWSLTRERIKFFYMWAYSLRVVMHSVYLETVNKYALGQSERVNCGLNLFKTISNINKPNKNKIPHKQILDNPCVFPAESNLIFLSNLTK